jgi:hypothetical protein
VSVCLDLASLQLEKDLDAIEAFALRHDLDPEMVADKVIAKMLVR